MPLDGGKFFQMESEMKTGLRQHAILGSPLGNLPDMGQYGPEMVVRFPATIRTWFTGTEGTSEGPSIGHASFDVHIKNIEPVSDTGSVVRIHVHDWESHLRGAALSFLFDRETNHGYLPLS